MTRPPEDLVRMEGSLQRHSLESNTQEVLSVTFWVNTHTHTHRRNSRAWLLCKGSGVGVGRNGDQWGERSRPIPCLLAVLQLPSSPHGIQKWWQRAGRQAKYGAPAASPLGLRLPFGGGSGQVCGAHAPGHRQSDNSFSNEYSLSTCPVPGTE